MSPGLQDLLKLRQLRYVAGSLKARITLGGIAALVLGIGLITLLLVSRAERDMLQFERQRELGEAVRTATRLSHRVVELQRSLQTISSQVSDATPDDDGAIKRLIEIRAVLRDVFTSLFIADSTGQVRLVVDNDGVRRPVVDLSDRKYFQRTVNQGRPHISEAVPSKESGAPVIVFTQPLRGPEGVRTVVGGGLRLNSRDLLDGLVDVQEGDVSQTLVVVTDAAGRVLAHPDRTRLLTSLADEPRLARAFAAWKASGSSVEPQGLMLRQADEVVSAAGVAGPDWMIWRTRNEASLLAPLRDARHDALSGAAALIALLSIGLLMLLRRLLTPLTLLGDRAKHLFDGRMPPQDGWPAAHGEIGALGRVLRRVGIERARLETLNTEVLGQLRSVMSAAPVGIAIAREGCFELVGTEFCRLFACSDADLLAQPVENVFASPEDHASFAQQEQDAFAAHRAYVGEWRLQRRDGTRFWASLRSKPVEAGDISRGAIWTLNNIDEQRAAREQLEWSATHDALTGLANRQAFIQQAERLLDGRPGTLPSAMVFIDLDHFKPVNDTAGHMAGDLMLLTVATAISSRVRTGDLVVRLGGDEFALLLEHCSHATALRIAEDVRSAIAEVGLPWDHGILRVGASLGVASLTAETETVASWLEAADDACYAAKDAGRDAVRSATTTEATNADIASADETESLAPSTAD